MKQYIVIAIILGVFCSTCEASQSKDVKEGNRLYSEGKYEEALEKYNEILIEDSETDIINFNAGAAFYKNEDYENATTQFRKALLGKDEALIQKAYYNLGNSLYNQGLNKEGEDAINAVKLLEESIGEYEKALNLDTEDEQVKKNHKFVSKELARIKKKLEQQKQQQEQDQKNKDDEDKEGNKENQSQGNSKDDKEDENSSSQDQGEEDKKDQQQSAQEDQEDDRSDQKSQAAQDKEDEKQNGQSQSGSMDESQKNTASNEENSKEMSDEEYKNFLDNYQQNEEPKGILNLQPRRTRSRVVEKDW